jgi:site-specific recombinase XerD
MAQPSFHPSDSLLPSWARSLRARNIAVTTVTSYLADVRHLLNFLGAATDEALLTVTRRDVEKFLAHGFDSGLKPPTVARRYRSLQQCFKWLAAEDEIAASPMVGMEPPRVPVQPPDIITPAELDALMSAARERANTGNNGRSGPFEARRDTALLLILATTGVRASELVGMTMDDVHLDAQSFTVMGKGGRSRVLPLTDKAAEAVDRYLRVRRRHTFSKLPALWLGEKGAMTDSGLRQMLERRCHAAGIRHINPHLFRHTFAHIAKLKGMPEDALMALGGWNSNQMLLRYGRSAVAERARDAHRKMFND